MSKNDKGRSLEQSYKDRQEGNDFEKKPGYGDKKLEGPNRPAE
jgi:hypothetical protein